MTVVGPFGLSVRDQALEADVQAGLVAVEEGLLEATKSEVPFITEAAQHLVRAGGKRFRPLLVMLSAQFGDPYAPGIVPSAVVVELTHLATLYHDDVMDEAAVRRGVPSANTRWDNSVAVLTGDFLFARASRSSPTSAPRRSASRPSPSNGWSPVRSWRRPARRTAATRSTTTWTCWAARRAPWWRSPAGSAR